MGWNRERLEKVVQQRLEGARLIVVANREPYIHRFEGDEIHCMRPAAVAGSSGVWIEKKRLACTVRYRGAKSRDADHVRRSVIDIGLTCNGHLRIVEGPLALEIMPNLGWSKGTAVNMIVDHLKLVDPLVFYAGDGDNDSEALEAVNERSGITIGIGCTAPRDAAHFLPDQEAFSRLLRSVAAALGDRKPLTTSALPGSTGAG